MRRLSLAVLAVSAACALVVPSSAMATDCPGADLRPAQDNMSQVSEATLCLLNAERAAESLGELTEQHQLTKASADFSQLMVDQHFFAHVGPDGSTLTSRLEASGYLGQPGSWTVGENIAWGESYLATPASIVKAWMDSPPHRENVLSPEFEEIGIGIVTGVPMSTNPGATYTTDFGQRTAAETSGDEDVVVTDDELVADDGAQVAQERPPGRVASKKKSKSKKSKSKKSKSKKSRKKSAPRRTRRGARRTGYRSKKSRTTLSMRAIRATVAH